MRWCSCVLVLAALVCLTSVVQPGVSYSPVDAATASALFGGDGSCGCDLKAVDPAEGWCGTPFNSTPSPANCGKVDLKWTNVGGGPYDHKGTGKNCGTDTNCLNYPSNIVACCE
jgi:hypothetical protein